MSGSPEQTRKLTDEEILEALGHLYNAIGFAAEMAVKGDNYVMAAVSQSKEARSHGDGMIAAKDELFSALNSARAIIWGLDDGNS